MIQISSNEINSYKSLTLKNNTKLIFTNLAQPEMAIKDSLVFISSYEMAKTALNNQATGFIVLEKIFIDVQNFRS